MQMNLSLPELQARLRYFSRRAQSLCGTVLIKKDGKLVTAPMGATVSAFFDELLKATTDPEKQRQRAEFLSRAQSDPAARQALNAIRIETFNNYLYASQNICDFFYEIVNLGPDERPVFQNTTMQDVNVYYTGADGTPKMVRVDRDDQEELKSLHYASTDWVRYKKVDLYRGSIVDAALATLKLSYDMKNLFETKGKTLLDTCYGTFSFTGKKQNYPYVANSRINVANLPTSNDLQIEGISASTGFGFPVFDSVVDYCARWAGADPEGDLKPTGRILVPGSDVKGISKGITPTNAKPSVPAEKILDAGWYAVHYLGIDWVMVPDNTLAPGTCYPELSRKPGRMWLKPSLDEEKTRNNDELDEHNEEERKMRKVVGFDVNSASRRFTCRVTYRSA